jgi:Flp pilus assembly secretin CpaC
MKSLFLALNVALLSWFLNPNGFGSAISDRGAEAVPDSLTLGVNLSKTLMEDKITKVSVGNSKILRAREVSPSEIVVTGLKSGKTSLTLWHGNRQEHAYLVSVLPTEMYDQLQNNQDEQVVRVELEFLELDTGQGRNLGLHLPEAIQGAGTGNFQGDGSNFGVNYAASVSSARGWLELLQREGWAQIVANPELHVRLGELATFHSGGELPITSTDESYGRFSKHIEWKSFGLTVKVRPQSLDLYRIASDIQVEISEIDRTAAAEGIPGLTKRNLDTKINSVDGETIILSGLVRRALGREEDAVPFISSIPFVGALFTRSHSRSESSELLMAVTFSIRSRALDDEKRERLQQKLEDIKNTR